MEVLLAAQVVSSSKIRATFLTMAYIYKERGGKFDLTKRQLRLLCGLTKEQLDVHLSVLEESGLIKQIGSRVAAIKLTYSEACCQTAFSFSKKEQASLDDLGLLPTYQYSRTKLAESARNARKKKLGDKAYANAQKQRRRHSVTSETELKVAEIMSMYDRLRKEYSDRLRPVNVAPSDNYFSSVIPRGRRARESKYFASFLTLLEEAEHHDIKPGDWMLAQFIIFDNIPYPNHLIGKGAYQRVFEAQELGLI